MREVTQDMSQVGEEQWPWRISVTPAPKMRWSKISMAVRTAPLSMAQPPALTHGTQCRLALAHTCHKMFLVRQGLREGVEGGEQWEL